MRLKKLYIIITVEEKYFTRDRFFLNYCLFCVVLCIVFVYMCTVLLPPGGYSNAVIPYNDSTVPFNLGY
jgi:hypothetical protein